MHYAIGGHSRRCRLEIATQFDPETGLPSFAR